MEVFLTLHHWSEAIGRFIGQLTFLAWGIALFVGPVMATLLASRHELCAIVGAGLKDQAADFWV